MYRTNLWIGVLHGVEWYFVFCLFIARKSEKPLKARLLVILDVTSLSYYTFLPRDDKHYKVYNITLIIYAVFALFAFIYGIHMFI